MITILQRFYMNIHFYFFTLQKITKQKHEYVLCICSRLHFISSSHAAVHRKLSCFFSRLSAEYHLCGAIWLFLLWILYKEYNNLRITRFLGSSKASVLSISLFIGGCLIIGLFPQLSEPEAEMRNGISASLGCYNFMTSWIFISILLLLLSNPGDDHHPRLSGCANKHAGALF